MADFNSFKNNWLGKSVDYDHAFQKQCVDLVREYLYENYGLGDAAGGVGTAIEYWTNTPAGILTKFDRIGDSAGRAGDVVILRTNGHTDDTPPGHIGIATGNLTDANVEILEQNGSDGSGNGIGGNAIRTRWVPRSRVAGLLRPKNPNATTEQVQQAYRDILEREADQGGLDHYVGHFMIDFVREDLMKSVERQQLSYNKDQARIAAEAAAKAAEEAAKQPENYATHYTYEKFEHPIETQTKIDANKWNLNYDDYPNAKSVAMLPTGTRFTAFGKATRNDLGHEIYYMDEADFGKAPSEAYGINYVDLEPYKLATGGIVTEPAHLHAESGSEEVAPTEDNSVPVTVIPSDPNKWKTTFNTFAAGEYKAVADTPIEDAELKLPKIVLYKGQEVPIAGTFTPKDGVEYYRTKTGLQNGTWYKIPKDAVTLIELNEMSDSELESVLDGLDMDIDLDKMKADDKARADARRKIESSGLRRFVYGIIARIEAYFAHKKTKTTK